MTYPTTRRFPNEQATGTGSAADGPVAEIAVLPEHDPRFASLVEWVLGETGRDRCGKSTDGDRRPAVPPRELLLVLARQGTRTVGAVLAHAPSKGVAEVLMPRLLPGSGGRLGERLVARITAELERRPIQVMVAYLAPACSEGRAWFVAQGYGRTRDLLVLCGDASAASPPDLPPGWRLRPGCSVDRESLGRMLTETSLESLDFPELAGGLPAEDRLRAMERAGGWGERCWSLVEWQGRLVGCLLVTDRPAADRCELTYWGLAPRARGRGRGQWLVRHALGQTRARGRSHLIAGVDSANDPALANYAQAGFVVIQRRQVFYRVPGSSCGLGAPFAG